ncbi:MAG: malto-oligosyltrehalose synthase, partial [Candidatus Omnitrophica bacterium]|nr:malto-oligosyltrehalose synthase [Candidatus Omnitrophota bacterium]MBD3269370.1 malto-oligosyltrehalose synthase [Candidatus Omnitrophota bacterium]
MHTPSTTYRIQFNSSFSFKDALAIAVYLKDLGIDALYASPILEARPGSSHGYDVTDPFKINPELGSGKELKALTDELRRLGIGWLQDIVPNHMAFDSKNKLLMDVLENGPNSKFFRYFDIDWNCHHENIRGRVLAPFLGKFYGDALENGEIKLVYEGKRLKVAYYDWRFPLKIETYFQVFGYRLERLKRKLGKDNQDLMKFLGALYSLKNLPGEEKIEERYRQIYFARNILAEIYSRNKQAREFIDGNIKKFNGKPGEAESFNLLDDLLSRQWFRLSFWKVANEEINYRRFFNINGLISLKMEDDEVFNNIHDFILKIYKENKFQGLRIDHIDGLYDPENYLRKLRTKFKNAYIVVEK